MILDFKYVTKKIQWAITCSENNEWKINRITNKTAYYVYHGYCEKNQIPVKLELNWNFVDMKIEYTIKGFNNIVLKHNELDVNDSYWEFILSEIIIQFKNEYMKNII